MRNLPFTVSLTSAHPRPATVDYATKDGLALAGLDYTATSGQTTFAVGETTKIVNVPVSEEDIGLDFTMALSKPVQCTLDEDTGSGLIGETDVPDSINAIAVRLGRVVEFFHIAVVQPINRQSGAFATQAVAIEATFLTHKALLGEVGEEIPQSRQDAADFYKTLGQALLDGLFNVAKPALGPFFRQEVPDDKKFLTIPHWVCAARGAIDALGEHIRVGEAYDVRPSFRAIYDGYVSGEPSAWRALIRGLALAIDLDDRDGKAAEWTKLAAAVKRTDVKTRNINDNAWIFRPLPKFPAIPNATDVIEQSDVYAFCNHPLAEPPDDSAIERGAKVEWTGYNFVSRDGGVDGDATPEAFVWTPEKMNDKDWPGSIVNGAIKINMPGNSSDDSDGLSGETASYARAIFRFGRKIDYTLRLATAYQHADTHLFAAIMCNKKPSVATTTWLYIGNNIWIPITSVGEVFEVYVSTSETFDESQRYYADIGQMDGFVSVGPGDANQFATATTEVTWDNPEDSDAPADGRPGYLLVKLTDLKRRSDSALVPAGARIRDVGIRTDMFGPFIVHLVAMRFVGGQDVAWVEANMQKAVTGDPQVWSPGVAPQVINGDMTRQKIVGLNGNPFFGQQLPDYFPDLSDEIEDVLDIEAGDLPTPKASFMPEYIIEEEIDTAVKPQTALLMEQQLLFLEAAQAAFVADGGTEGPFAHTFAMNTASLAELVGPPTPGTWVYQSPKLDSSNGGYQARVAEALARVVRDRDEPGYKACRTLARTIALKWLTWLNGAWPTIPGSGVRGPPDTFIDPGTAAPSSEEEAPHVAALALRACLWLKGIEDTDFALSVTELLMVDALGQRCWDYLDILFQTDSAGMRFTWNDPNAAQIEYYFGMWHFEIITTLAHLVLAEAAHVPGTIDTRIAIQRLAQTRRWIEKNKVDD